MISRFLPRRANFWDLLEPAINLLAVGLQLVGLRERETQETAQYWRDETQALHGQLEYYQSKCGELCEALGEMVEEQKKLKEVIADQTVELHEKSEDPGTLEADFSDDDDEEEEDEKPCKCRRSKC